MGDELMQPLAAGAKLGAYQGRLRSSHDFRIYVDILNLDEQQIGSCALLDGQVNIQSGELVRRTAALTISDPAGALDFSNTSATNGSGLWLNRLVRVRHVVDVPPYGEITAVPFVGCVTGLSRQGAEVQVTCSDKAFLAIRGTRPLSAPKGALATDAIIAIMRRSVGEFRFRIPKHTRRLSKNYSVGLSNDASPMKVAAQIASAELDMQLLYSCDGALMLRPNPTNWVVDMGWVTDQASASADFTTVSNFVQVSGKVKSKTTGNKTVTTQPVSTVAVAAPNSIAPSVLTRQGVQILLPQIITEDAYTTTAQTAVRAQRELTSASRVVDDLSASVVPMFHLDADDVVLVHTDDGASRTLTLTESSIPLGVGGDMTIGFHRWVSTPALARPKSRIVRTTKVHSVKKKHPAKKRHHK